MARRIICGLIALLAVACHRPATTPVEAAEEICEQLLDGEFDAVMDRMYEWNPQQQGEEFALEVWIEQAAARQVRGVVRQQIETVFAHPTNPIEAYEVVGERYAADSLSAAVQVEFVQRDANRIPYTFTLQRVENGVWRSVKMFR